jgi:hypothetical protein
MISKRNSWNPAPIGEMMWFFEMNANTSTLWFGRRNDGGPGGIGNPPLPEGEWQHLAITCDGATAIMYRDGVQANSGDFTLGSMTDAGLSIGSGYAGGGGPFNGTIDDVRLYNHALSADEVQDAMFGQVLQAYGPEPADGAMHEGTWANLSWTAGNTAASHDVYFGDNFADVNAGAEGTFQGSQTDTFLIVGFVGFAFPGGLAPGTTYYWRVDEVEADGTTIHKGNVWSLTVPPKIAFNPSPATGAKFIETDVTLAIILTTLQPVRPIPPRALWEVRRMPPALSNWTRLTIGASMSSMAQIRTRARSGAFRLRNRAEVSGRTTIRA